MYLIQPLRLHPTEVNLNMAQVRIREVRHVIQFTVPCTVSVSTLHRKIFPLLLAPWVHTVCPLTFPTGPPSPHVALCWPLWSACQLRENENLQAQWLAGVLTSLAVWKIDLASGSKKMVPTFCGVVKTDHLPADRGNKALLRKPGKESPSPLLKHKPCHYSWSV